MKRVAIGLFAAVVGLQPGLASAQTLSASGRGWITSSGLNNGNGPLNGSFAGTHLGVQARDHFDFLIPTFSGTLVSATLVLTEPASTPYPGHAGVPTTYSLYSVGAFGTYNYSSMGNGTLYATSILTSATNGSTVSILLNPAALAAITAMQGSTFSLAGVDSGENSIVDNTDFYASNGSLSQLVLTEAVATPEPSSVAVIAGFFSAGYLGLRRKRIAAR